MPSIRESHDNGSPVSDPTTRGQGSLAVTRLLDFLAKVTKATNRWHSRISGQRNRPHSLSQHSDDPTTWQRRVRPALLHTKKAHAAVRNGTHTTMRSRGTMYPVVCSLFLLQLETLPAWYPLVLFTCRHRHRWIGVYSNVLLFFSCSQTVTGLRSSSSGLPLREPIQLLLSCIRIATHLP